MKTRRIPRKRLTPYVRRQKVQQERLCALHRAQASEDRVGSFDPNNPVYKKIRAERRELDKVRTRCEPCHKWTAPSVFEGFHLTESCGECHRYKIPDGLPAFSTDHLTEWCPECQKAMEMSEIMNSTASPIIHELKISAVTTFCKGCRHMGLDPPEKCAALENKSLCERYNSWTE